jgi:hypothetical protein
METKKQVYITLFTILGFLIGFLVHALVEIIYIRLLASDFVAYSFGLSWSELVQFFYLFSAIVFVVCGLWGYAAGKFWWKQIYVLKKYQDRRMAGIWRW